MVLQEPVAVHEETVARKQQPKRGSVHAEVPGTSKSHQSQSEPPPQSQELTVVAPAL